MRKQAKMTPVSSNAKYQTAKVSTKHSSLGYTTHLKVILKVIKRKIQGFYFVLFSITGLPVLESLEYRMTTGYLVARSNGGPAQTVLWNRNGSAVSYSRLQSVTNVSLAAYENFLFLNDTPSNIIGTYTCQIYNGMGISRLLSHDLQGKKNMSEFFT